MIKRCSKCILPVSFPGVSLDESGKCNYCHSFEKKCRDISRKTEKGLQLKLEKLLGKFRGKGFYDCLVPVSGGKDSMYVLYVLSKIYNLKVLAFNFDNGFQSPGAVRNLERAVKILGVDFIKYKPSEDIMIKLYRTFLFRAGDFCAPCNLLIEAGSKRFARQNGISLIVMGSCKRWSAAILGMSISKYANRRYYKNVVKGHIDIEKIKNYIPEPPRAINLLKRQIQTINLFDYFNPMKNQILETMEKEIGWKPPSDELEHGDCLVNTVKDYIVCKRWGFSEVTGGYSAMVRNGKMSREEALRKAEEEEVRNPPAALETFLKKVGLSHDDFEEAIKNHHFTDFSNNYSAPYRLSMKIINMIRFK